MATEEVEQEVEAMEAVYGSDSIVFQLFPPHLSILMRPRTADDPSVQFVEAVLVIKAGEQYPEVPPELQLKDVKGLGDSRHAQLLGDLEAQAAELAGGPMLVAICEAATVLLTNMNMPDGDCSFCLDPLVMDDVAKPFMKLMTCFHCFHSDCFGDWWRWLRQEQPGRPLSSQDGVQGEDGRERSLEHSGSSEGRSRLSEELQVHCPVCRKIILAEDVAHVQDFLTKRNGVKPYEGTKVPIEVLTDAELVRRAQFSTQFEAQLERGGIIENKKLEVIQPGMIAPPRAPPEDDRQEDLRRGVATRSDASFSESNSQRPGRHDTQAGRSRLHPNDGLDGFRGRGRSYGGLSGGGRSYRGRQAQGTQAKRGYRGRSGPLRDMGISETCTMQSQDTRPVERNEVETTRTQSQGSTQLERGVTETSRMHAQDTRQLERASVDGGGLQTLRNS